MRRHLLSLSTLAAIFSLHALCHADLRLKKGDFSGQGYALRALLGKNEDQDMVIRRIGAGSDDAKVRELLDFAEDITNRRFQSQNLEIVRALARHRHGPHRERVVQTLVEFFRQPTGDAAQAQADSAQSLELLIRGSSAMALARAQHALAARVLLAAAGANDENDPEGTHLARLALEAVPPASEILQAPGLRPLDEQEISNESPSSPSELIHAMQEEERSHSKDPPSWAMHLAKLRQSPSPSGAWQEKQKWQEAYELSAVWTLRALALLSPTNNGTRKWATNLAESSLDAPNSLQRAAAAFCLSSLAPQKAAPLLNHKDPVIRQAVLNQSHDGVLAKAARHLSTRFEADEILGLRTSLHAPSLWPTWSTQELEELQLTLNSGGEWRSPLAARFSDGKEKGRAPDLSQIDSWLESDDPTIRAQAIQGLSLNRAASTPGLLIERYRLESDESVRRGICKALWRHKLTQRAELTALFDLEIDPGCRARLQGQSDPETHGFSVGWSLEKFVTIIDRDGVAHLVRPAPDGFVSLVHPNL